MKFKKKLLSFVLCLTFFFTLIPSEVQAESTLDPYQQFLNNNLYYFGNKEEAFSRSYWTTVASSDIMNVVYKICNPYDYSNTADEIVEYINSLDENSKTFNTDIRYYIFSQLTNGEADCLDIEGRFAYGEALGPSIERIMYTHGVTGYYVTEMAQYGTAHIFTIWNESISILSLNPYDLYNLKDCVPILEYNHGDSITVGQLVSHLWHCALNRCTSLSDCALYDSVFVTKLEKNINKLNATLEQNGYDKWEEWVEKTGVTNYPLIGGLNEAALDLVGWLFVYDTEEVVESKLNDVADQMIEGTSARATSTWQEAADLVSCYILDDFSPNFDTFMSFFGIEKESDSIFLSIFRIIGLVLAILLLVWTLFMIFLGPITDVRDGFLKLFARFLMALIGIVFSSQIMKACFSVATIFWDALISAEYEGTYLANAFFPMGRLDIAFPGLGELLSMILTLTIGFIIFKNFIRLFVEVIERYLVTSMLYLCFPIGIATSVSSSTAPIFKSYLRMIASQLFLMIMNIWFIRMFFILMSNGGADRTLDQIIFFFFVIAFLRVAQRLDSYMASLGLSVAQTGGGLLDSCAGAVYMMGNTLSMMKSGGKLASRATGSILSTAAVKTGSTSLMKAGALMSHMGGKKGPIMSSGEQLHQAQMARGITPDISVNGRMWNQMAMGSLKSANGLTNESIMDGLSSNMEASFMENNPNMKSLHASNNGSVITGYSQVGVTANGKSIDAGFTLSRQASAGATEYSDTHGNSWYMNYERQRSRPLDEGDAIYTNAANFKDLTGIDAHQVAETVGEDYSNFGMAVKHSKGWEFRDGNSAFICGVGKSGVTTDYNSWNNTKRK